MARLLAQRLGYAYIETGAMYRAVALEAARRGIFTSDAEALERLARKLPMRFVPTAEGNRLMLGEEDVTDAVRTPEITEAASVVSTVPGVRRALVERQRGFGSEGKIIMEGRDIGTKVFPDAEVKVFLDAAPEVRGERRFIQVGDRRLEQTIHEMRERDRRDRERAESPLVQAPDAVYLDSSKMTEMEVVDIILELLRRT
ncbi:MAG: (d)CMP kinase [Dongiaceae bacterium]